MLMNVINYNFPKIEGRFYLLNDIKSHNHEYHLQKRFS